MAGFLILKKLFAQTIAHQNNNHTQPKSRKKIHAPENCATPLRPSPPTKKRMVHPY